jgi:hypothetical protein
LKLIIERIVLVHLMQLVRLFGATLQNAGTRPEARRTDAATDRGR